MIRRSKRKVIQCEKCKAFKDLSQGRLLITLVLRPGLGDCQIFESQAWLCYECLPENDDDFHTNLME